jgi:hypothetical protein
MLKNLAPGARAETVDRFKLPRYVGILAFCRTFGPQWNATAYSRLQLLAERLRILEDPQAYANSGLLVDNACKRNCHRNATPRHQHNDCLCVLERACANGWVLECVWLKYYYGMSPTHTPVSIRNILENRHELLLCNTDFRVPLFIDLSAVTRIYDFCNRDPYYFIRILKRYTNFYSLSDIIRAVIHGDLPDVLEIVLMENSKYFSDLILLHYVRGDGLRHPSPRTLAVLVRHMSDDKQTQMQAYTMAQNYAARWNMPAYLDPFPPGTLKRITLANGDSIGDILARTGNWELAKIYNEMQ